MMFEGFSLECFVLGVAVGIAIFGVAIFICVTWRCDSPDVHETTPIYRLELSPFEEWRLMERFFWRVPYISGGGYYTFDFTGRGFKTKEEGEAAIKRLLERQDD